MGAWGTGIFSDDNAADIRDDFRDLIGDGLSSKEATERLMSEWNESLTDPDVGPVFWLALAATQWKLGRLVEYVRQRAVATIDDGSDLVRWQDDPKAAAGRRRHLEKLKAMLESPPPEPRIIGPRFKNRCDWFDGEVVAYQMKSGTMILLRVIGIHSDKGGDSPICEVLDWSGVEIPPEGVLRKLPIRASVENFAPQLMIGAVIDREFPRDRVFRTGIISKPSQKPGRCSVTLWRNVDRVIGQMFGFV